MNKFSVFLFIFLPFWLFSQDFSFSPSANLSGDMDVDGYGVHQINIVNETEDSLWLTWRLVENTLPQLWDVNLCDNVLCYGVMPTSADMNPIAPDSAAFIRMTTYPLNNSGSGDLHFWIYKTGFPQDHVSMTFQLSSGLTNTGEISIISHPMVYPNPTSGLLFVDLPSNAPVTWVLVNSLGQALKRGLHEGYLLQVAMDELSPGTYWLQLIQKGTTTVLPIQRQ